VARKPSGSRGNYVSPGNFIEFQGNPQFAHSFALGLGGFLDGRLIHFQRGARSGIPNGVNNDGTALMLRNPNWRAGPKPGADAPIRIGVCSL